MGTHEEVDFLEYLSIEEKNVSNNIILFKEEYDVFYNLDRVFKDPIKRLNLQGDLMTNDKKVIFTLYFLVISQLYSSYSSILRNHLSDSMSSIRIAIDAGLSAYRIMLEPTIVEKYLTRDKYFLYIKKNMKSEVKEDNAKYPLAHLLFDIYDDCSQYGTHADIDSFFYRIDESAGFLLLDFFQTPKNEHEYRLSIFYILNSFFLIFQIFQDYLLSVLSDKDNEWEETNNYIRQKLVEMQKKAVEGIKIAHK